MVGWFEEDLDPFLDLFSLESVVTNLWYLKNGVKILVLGGQLLLLDFDESFKAKRMLARESRRLKNKVLHLVKWTLEVVRLLKGGFAKEVWVRVLGLPLYLWSWEVH